jgi:tellurite resistance protein
MFGFFKEKEVKNEIEILDNHTQERLIEALLIVAYADGIIKVTETEGIEDIINSIQWKENLLYQGKFGELIENVRASLENENRLNGMINKIKELDIEKNQMIVRLCEKMASIDGKFDSSEKSIIERLRK